MKKLILFFSFVCFTIFCRAQDADRIYSFMNNELPAQEFGKSSWGIFFSDRPAILDSAFYRKILENESGGVPKAIQQELYKNCMALTFKNQQDFIWEQSKMKNDIIVADTKHKLPVTLVSKLAWTKSRMQIAKYWVNEWNKSKAVDRLINYSSVPVFSRDGNYVLILRGQDVKTEGGWDTIYLYKKEKDQWIIADQLVVSTI